MRFESMWIGPSICDHVENKAETGICYSSTFLSVGLYALDKEGQPWTFCQRLYSSFHKWIRLDDLMSGAAARQYRAENESKTVEE